VKTSNPACQPFLYQDFREALTTLKTALSRSSSPYALLLGESGSGKTTLLRQLAAQLDQRRFHILYLCQGQPSPSGLTRVLADALHLPTRRSRVETGRLLVATLRNLSPRFLFWIDEAQRIDDDTLHEIRLLAEADLDAPPLFSVLFSALPHLRERLLAPQLFPLWRRIRPKVTLTGLRRGELLEFLSHSLGKSLAERFEQPALDLLFEQSKGIPAVLATFAEECLRTQPKGPIAMQQLAAVLDRIEAS